MGEEKASKEKKRNPWINFYNLKFVFGRTIQHMKYILIVVISYGFKLWQFSVPVKSAAELKAYHRYIQSGFSEFKQIIKRYAH